VCPARELIIVYLMNKNCAFELGSKIFFDHSMKGRVHKVSTSYYL
jgi:hypothetical protein